MRRALRSSGGMLLLMAACAGPATAAEPALDEIIAKHIEARGGAARWRAVRSL